MTAILETPRTIIPKPVNPYRIKAREALANSGMDMDDPITEDWRPLATSDAPPYEIGNDELMAEEPYFP